MMADDTPRVEHQNNEQNRRVDTPFFVLSRPDTQVDGFHHKHSFDRSEPDTFLVGIYIELRNRYRSPSSRDTSLGFTL